jgi:uncharacterized protein DUF3300
MRSISAVLLSVAVTLSVGPAFAQTGEPGAEQVSPGAAGADTAVAVEEPGTPLLSEEEIDALTSPIALYPDPLLELTLQGATFPLQAVQAVRFLEKHAKDPASKPDPAWDESILGLLNYPVVLEAFNNDLDWTEALGKAVLTQLDDVQESIQQFRSQLYAGGVLKSDEKQRVIVSNEVIAILPADAEIIYVPNYDAAGYAATEETETASDTSAEAALEPAAGAEPAQVAEVGAAADAQEAAPAAPATAPVQTVTTTQPTQVVYSEPYPSYWSPVATFLGGAAIGGLIGYAIGDDDDDCCDFDDDDWDGGGNNWSRNVNIEDSNIIINRDDDVLGNRDQVRHRDVQSELRKRQGRGPTAAVNQRDLQSKGTAPARKARAAQPAQQPAGLNKPAQQKASKADRQRPGDTNVKRADTGALSGAKGSSGKQVKAESRRGSESRSVAKNKAPTQQVQAKKRPQTASGLSKPKSNKQVQRQSNRGKASGGGKKRRG